MGFRVCIQTVQTSPLWSAVPFQSISFGLTPAFLCGLLSASCYLPYPQSETAGRACLFAFSWFNVRSEDA